MDRVSGDAQILESSTQESHMRYIANKGVLGGNLSHDTVGRDNVKDVEALYRRRGQCAPAVAGLEIFVSSDLSVSGTEGDDPFKAIVCCVLGEVPAVLREFQMSLGFDFLDQRKLQMAFENCRFRMIAVHSFDRFGHWLITLLFVDAGILRHFQGVCIP